MKVIYLTGAPAAGKSSTLQKVVDVNSNVLRIEYGAELTKLVQSRNSSVIDQDQLRSLSAVIVTPEDIKALDDEILSRIERERGKRSIILDSHPVTKERYGFRVTAFSEEKVKKLRPDEIWVFYTSPPVAVKRIEADPAGRPIVSEEEARTHTLLQASVAATYGILTGAPVYMFDTDLDQEKLVQSLLERLKR